MVVAGSDDGRPWPNIVCAQVAETMWDLAVETRWRLDHRQAPQHHRGCNNRWELSIYVIIGCIVVPLDLIKRRLING